MSEEQVMKVRSLLHLNPQKLGMIQLHLGLDTRHKAMEVMEALEAKGEVYCSAGVWHLTNKCHLCDEPIRFWIDDLGYCAGHALLEKEGA